MQYVINKNGDIVRDFKSLAEAHAFIFKDEDKTLEVIDEEEKMYRAVEWCSTNGFEYDEVLEDADGEFVFEEEHNYAHPADTGASVDTVKVYVNYKSKKTLEEAIKEMTA